MAVPPPSDKLCSLCFSDVSLLHRTVPLPAVSSPCAALLLVHFLFNIKHASTSGGAFLPLSKSQWTTLALHFCPMFSLSQLEAHALTLCQSQLLSQQQFHHENVVGQIGISSDLILTSFGMITSCIVYLRDFKVLTPPKQPFLDSSPSTNSPSLDSLWKPLQEYVCFCNSLGFPLQASFEQTWQLHGDEPPLTPISEPALNLEPQRDCIFPKEIAPFQCSVTTNSHDAIATAIALPESAPSLETSSLETVPLHDTLECSSTATTTTSLPAVDNPLPCHQPTTDALGQLIYTPYTHDIVLLCDFHEKISPSLDKSGTTPSTSQLVPESLIEQLTQRGCDCASFNLVIGDFLWVSIPKTIHALHPSLPPDILLHHAHVLDYIIERKTGGDLSSSISTERFRNQRQRLWNGGLSNVIYLIEHPSLSPNLILPSAKNFHHHHNRSHDSTTTATATAMASLTVEYGFTKLFSSSQADSINCLVEMHQIIQHEYTRRFFLLVQYISLQRQMMTSTTKSPSPVDASIQMLQPISLSQLSRSYCESIISSWLDWTKNSPLETDAAVVACPDRSINPSPITSMLHTDDIHRNDANIHDHPMFCLNLLQHIYLRSLVPPDDSTTPSFPRPVHHYGINTLLVQSQFQGESLLSFSKRLAKQACATPVFQLGLSLQQCHGVGLDAAYVVAAQFQSMRQLYDTYCTILNSSAIIFPFSFAFVSSQNSQLLTNVGKKHSLTINRLNDDHSKSSQQLSRSNTGNNINTPSSIHSSQSNHKVSQCFLGETILSELSAHDGFLTSQMSSSTPAMISISTPELLLLLEQPPDSNEARATLSHYCTLVSSQSLQQRTKTANCMLQHLQTSTGRHISQRISMLLFEFIWSSK